MRKRTRRAFTLAAGLALSVVMAAGCAFGAEAFKLGGK